MKVVIKHPGKIGEHADIPNNLEDLQALVGGYIEIVHVNADMVAIVNEEGKLKKLPKNCCGLVGTIVFAGTDDQGELTDIDPDYAEVLTDGFVPMMGGTCFVKGED